MAVVKANAYGAGAVKVAEQALKSGADMLGVARIEEALQLRKAGVTSPMLIFSYVPPDFVNNLIDYDLTSTIFSRESAYALSTAAQKKGSKIKVHLKVDTGMGRLGIVLDRSQFSESSSEINP